MGESYKENGVQFNLREIRKNDPDIWWRYREELIKFPNIEEMDYVYFSELTDYIDGRVVFNFLKELLPRELREELEMY